MAGCEAREVSEGEGRDGLMHGAGSSWWLELRRDVVARPLPNSCYCSGFRNSLRWCGSLYCVTSPKTVTLQK